MQSTVGLAKIEENRFWPRMYNNENRRYRTLWLGIFLYSWILSLAPFIEKNYPNIFNFYFYVRFLVFLYIAFIVLLARKNKFAIWDRVITGAWAVIVISYISVDVVSKNPSGVLYGLSIFSHIIVFRGLLNTRDKLVAALDSTMWASITFIVISFLLTLMFPDFRVYANVKGYKILRAGGLAYNAQQLSLYVVTGFIFLLYKFNKLKKFKDRFFFISVISVVLAMSLLTGSRTALVSILFCGLIVYVLEYKSLSKLFYIITAIMIVLAFANSVGILNSFYEKFFLRGEKENLLSLGLRIYLWKIGLSKFLESPYWGHGYQTIREVLTPMGIKKIFMPHNGFLFIALDIGLIGLISFTIMLIRVFTLWKKLNKRELKYDKSILNLAITIVLWGIIGNFTESWFFRFGFPPTWAFWLSIALIAIKHE